MKNYWRCHYGDGGFDQKPWWHRASGMSGYQIGGNVHARCHTDSGVLRDHQCLYWPRLHASNNIHHFKYTPLLHNTNIHPTYDVDRNVASYISVEQNKNIRSYVICI